MGSLGVPELIIILLIVILIFGASRLPGLASGVGKAIKNFKDATRDDKNAYGGLERLPTGRASGRRLVSSPVPCRATRAAGWHAYD